VAGAFIIFDFIQFHVLHSLSLYFAPYPDPLKGHG
jgi:hypothetical protein